ncbi:MAG: DUF3857 domain-containing protein [Sandaracinus sp.]
MNAPRARSGSRPPSAGLACALFLVLSLAPGRVRAQEGVEIAPGIEVGGAWPAWAEPARALPGSRNTEGTEALAREIEWHVEGDHGFELRRSAYVMHTAASVAERSELEIRVPAGDALSLLYVRRVRDGETRDVLTPAQVHVAQPESRLEDGLYDESRRLLVLLEDARPGDVVDYAYVRRAEMRRFGGRFAVRATLAGEPVHHARLVVRWPSDRAIAFRAHGLEGSGLQLSSEPSGVVIEGDDPPMPRVVLDAPGWVDTLSWLDVSELSSWDDVSRWASPLYATASLAPSELGGVPLATFAALPTPEERAEAAIRFVQDEVRYLGIEVEERTHAPTAPAVVLERRYGDCKDKALLLVTLLRALGIEAHPALVDTERGPVLDDDLPSPLAFDHVVVRLRLEGSEHWVDATRAYERGPLAARTPLRFAHALVLGDGSTALTEIPAAPPAQPDMEVDEHYDVSGGQRLEVVTHLRGTYAMQLRAALAARGTAEIEADYRAAYASAELSPQTSAPFAVEEQDDGSLVVRESYRITGFWNALDRDVSPWSSAGILPVAARDRPPVALALPHPRWILHRVRIDAESYWEIEPSREQLHATGFDVEQVTTVSGRTLLLETSLRTLADHVAAGDLARYTHDRDLAAPMLGFAVHLGRNDEDEATQDRPVMPWIVVGALVALFAAGLWLSPRLRRWLDGRRARAWRAAHRSASGESAADAIAVADLPEAERRAAPFRCCGAALETRWSRAQLGGATLAIQGASCEACGRTHRRYFRPASTRDPVLPT